MPELPEVETIRRQLEKQIIGKELGGKKIAKIRRRGKILIIDFSDDSSLIFHLKMTGQLVFNGKKTRFTRRVFRFSDGSQLVFNDVRKLGWVKRVKNTKKLEQSLGLEPLAMNFTEFGKILRNKPKIKIKTLLMDQKYIAGIGNIYSDEILYTAGIHPLRRAGDLEDGEIKRLFGGITKILGKAIKKGGSSTRDYRDAFGQSGAYARHHKVYQKEGKMCFRCRTPIKRIKIGGRSAHYCPKCQKF